MLEAKHISFAMGRSLILTDVSLTVAPGEVAVITGGNGVGKSSLLRILAGVLRPCSGVVLANERDVFDNLLSYQRVLGYLPAKVALDVDMRVKAYLKYRALLRGEYLKKIRHRVDEALSLCGLMEVKDCFIRSLSDGMRKRVALADAILLRPEFLLLDDLLVGLDFKSRAGIGQILHSLSRLTAVVITGHEINELARWATKFYVLQAGMISEFKSSTDVQRQLEA